MTAPLPRHPDRAEAPRLPPASVLLHIGPFKTGTTAIQGALQAARDTLPDHGVLYPGNGRRAMRPGWAVLGRKQRGRAAVPIAEWEKFAAEVRAAAGMRVCVSTEDFGSASPSQAARIVGDLGGDRVHVVAVARRLDRLLPSQWQERVKSHDVVPYEDWLRSVLGDDPTDPHRKRFWASHDVVRMFERWEPAVGRDRFRLIVTDGSDIELLPRLFEQMLDLPKGLLALAPYTNASLTGNATELLRRLNEVFAERGWPDDLYHRAVQRGMQARMVSAPRSVHEERLPPLPRWAAERVAELSERRLTEIAERGIHVVGDPRLLRTDPSDSVADGLVAPDEIALESAVAALAGIVEGVRDLQARRRRRFRRELAGMRASRPPAGRLVDEASGRELLREAVRRGGRRLWPVRRTGRRPRRSR